MKPSDLMPKEGEHAESGVYRLIERLKLRWPEGTIRKLPRLYRRFFKEQRFSGDMDQFLTALTQARDELEAADEHARISDGILGWAALELAGLTEQEQAHVIGLAGNSMRFSMIRPHLEALYSRGSYSAPRSAHVAEPSEYEDEEDDWYEDDDYWYDPEETGMDETYDAEKGETGDDPSVYMTEEITEEERQAMAECEDAYMNFRPARQSLNEIRTSQKFSKGKNRKGKGEGAAGSKGMDKRFIRCFSCGRLGHRAEIRNVRGSVRQQQAAAAAAVAVH